MKLANCRWWRDNYVNERSSLCFTTTKFNWDPPCQNRLLQEFLHRLHWPLCRTPNMSILQRTPAQYEGHRHTNLRFNSHCSSPSVTIYEHIESPGSAGICTL